jgi:hypothetical protein
MAGDGRRTLFYCEGWGCLWLFLLVALASYGAYCLIH